MDYATKILLDNLVEAVEKLNHPDWGMIVLTAINIGAFIFVAVTQIRLQKQQTKLQEQQAKAQEYGLYFRLYKAIRNLDRLISEHISISLFNYGPLRNIAHNPFAEKIEQVSKCIEEFDNCLTDFELKFPQEKDVIEKYRSVITEMQNTYHFLDNLAVFEKEEKRDFRTIWMRCRLLNNEDDYELKKVLLSLLKDRYIKKMMEEYLRNFIKDKEYLQKRNLLDKIAKHCISE